MWSLEGLVGHAMVADISFTKFQRVIRIGGNIGHFLHKIMSANPTSKGILFDRPEVVVATRQRVLVR